MNYSKPVYLNSVGDDNSPLISIIMNCYNGEQYLREAIDSIFTQTYQNWEIIFWDNQSTDNSAKVFKNYKDSRLHYYASSKHCLLYEARKFAFEKTKGKFIAFLDVDDWWDPKKLAQQMLLFSDKKVGLVYSNYWLEDTNNKSTKLIYKKLLPSGYVLDKKLRDYSIGMLTMVLRREAIESLSFIFDPRYQIIGDFDLAIRLAVKWKFASIQNPLAHYRLHDNNMSSRYRGLHNQEVEQWLNEAKNNHEISIQNGYHYQKKLLVYLQGQEAIENKDIKKVIKCLLTLPFRLKLKLFMFIILPNSVIERLRRI